MTAAELANEPKITRSTLTDKGNLFFFIFERFIVYTCTTLKK